MLEIAKHDCGSTNEAYCNLRNAIIESAMDDYKAMITGKKRQGGDNNVKKIESFFMSDYCSLLLVDTGLTGKDILRELHGFRDEYYNSLAKKKKNGRIRRK